MLGPGRMYLKVMGLQRDEDLVCSIMKIFCALGASEPNGTGPIQIPSPERAQHGLVLSLPNYEESARLLQPPFDGEGTNGPKNPSG